MAVAAGELDDARMAELLRLRVEEGEPSPDSFVREVDVYSDDPENIIRGLDPAPSTQGKGEAWCFYSPAIWQKSSGGAQTRRRKRQVGGGGRGGVRCWHQEKKGKKLTLGPHGAAYSTTFSYVLKAKNPPESAKAFLYTRLGWSMTEIELQRQRPEATANQLIFCKLYRSPRTISEKARSVRVPRPAPRRGSVHRTADVAVALPDRRLTTVMKFGGSSMSCAKGMKEVASLLCRFTEEKPVVVLSAMRNTTNNLLLAAHQAKSWDAQKVCEIHELEDIKKLHLSTVHDLQIHSATVSGTLDLLEQHLMIVARTKELTPKALDYILSFGERLSTGVLSAYLNKLETRARQYDELDLGLITIDKCTDIVEATYSAIAERLEGDWTDEPAMPILAGFLGKIWKNVDGVFTCDPNICSRAKQIPFLTFDEAAELAYFGEQALTILERCGISVDYMATSKGKVWLAIDPSKLLSCELFQQVLDNAVGELQKTAAVHVLQHRAVVSLVGNTEMSSLILRKVVKVSLVVHDSEAKECVQALHSAFFENSWVSELERAENKCQIPAYSSTSASSGVIVKRKAVDDHPEASTRQRTTSAEPSGHEETEPRLPEGDNGDPTEVFQSISDDNIPPVTNPSMFYADMDRLISEEIPVGGDDNGDWSKYFSGEFDHFDGGYDTNWTLSGGNDGEGPSGVGSGVPEEDANPVLPEQPDDPLAASWNYH
ncbi:hypothetical protein ACQ4PT_029645 [Festuca glaucescens]